MFDYQAGEKYKLTLIMVAVAGLLAGMFFTMLIMPAPEPATRKRGSQASQRVLSDPDITGGARRPAGYGEPGAAGPGGAGAQTGAAMVDRSQAELFMNGWLPRIWDLSAGSAVAHQEEAIKYMTPECAGAYRRNIWTADLAKQVAGSGLQSTWRTNEMNISQNLADGSVVIKVKGTQALGVPGKGGKQRDVNLEYMLKQTPEGLRIAGISEAGKK